MKPKKTIRNNKDTERKKEVLKTDKTDYCPVDNEVEDLIYLRLMAARDG